MQEGFSWTISGATILVVLGWVATVITMTWNRSAKETALKNSVDANDRQLSELTKEWKSLASERQAWRDTVERDIEHRIENLVKATDQRFGALQASDRLLSEQLGEVRENLAKNYMTKEEIAEIERRVTVGQERIITRVDRLDEKLDGMQRTILEAIKRQST